LALLLMVGLVLSQRVLEPVALFVRPVADSGSGGSGPATGEGHGGGGGKEADDDHFLHLWKRCRRELESQSGSNRF
jgi:hypothetical protein